MDDVVFSDLNQLDLMTPSDEGNWLEILNPVNKKTIVFKNQDGDLVTMAFKLAGPHSERMQRYFAESLDRTVRDGRKGTLANDAEAIRTRETLVYAHATLDWRVPMIDGEWLPYSPQAVRRVLSDLRFTWVREQVAAGVGDADPFLKKLQTRWNDLPNAR